MDNKETQTKEQTLASSEMANVGDEMDRQASKTENVGDGENRIAADSASLHEMNVADHSAEGDGNDVGKDAEQAYGMKDEETATDQKPADVDETFQEDEDEDVRRLASIQGKDDAWKKVKRPPKWSASRVLLMTGVIVGVPWLVYGNLSDISYFFSSSSAVDLGDASDYIRSTGGKPGKAQDFEDNKLVRMKGFPVHQIAIKTKDGGLTHKTKLIYQLMGSSVYVEEPLENSKYAQFVSSTKTQFSMDAGVVAVDVEGRLRRFDTADAKQYAPVRSYYTDNYGVTFCNSLSQSEKTRRQSQLGKGGLILQVMPDKSVLEGDTGTQATIRDIVPLRGRRAVAVTDTNERLTTADAGRTWTKAALPFDAPVTAMAYAPQTGQIVYARQNGQIGPENYQPEYAAMTLTQDVEDMIFNAPENVVVEPGTAGVTNVPAMVAVGREGLIQLAWQDREGWLPSPLIQPSEYHDIMRIGDTVYVVGSNGALMERRLVPGTTWQYSVSPESADWYGLTRIDDQLVAVGSNGKVIRRKALSDEPWEIWPFDDVPGIDFKATLRASALSGDGKQWVAVGDDGAIVTAKRDDKGDFGRYSALTESFAGYGFVDDIAQGMAPTEALARVMDRHTELTLFDVTWHHGKFYAVGEKGLFMTSTDGHAWTKSKALNTTKRLNAIRFVDDSHGFIGGENGTLLMTSDGGETWKPMKSPTKRSIFRIMTDPSVPNIFVFAGAYGMWGYCYAEDSRCFLRSRNQEEHYRSIALATDAKKPNQMRLIAVGDRGRIDGIDDTLGPDALRSFAQTRPAEPMDIAVADSPVPLKPGYGGGQLALIASTDGQVFRSTDAGYTFVRTPTGLTDDIVRVMLSEDGDMAYALSRTGKVARALHGTKNWQVVPFPQNARMAFGTVVGKTAIFADRQCLYSVESADDAQATAIVCFDDDTIENVTGVSRTEILVESASGTLYHLSTASDAGIGKLEMPLPTVDSASEPAQNGEPASPKPKAFTKLMSCNGVLWYAHQQEIYRLQNNDWQKVGAMAGNVINYVCDQSGIVAVTSKERTPGVWELETTKLDTVGAEELWKVAVGFDPTHAQVAHTKDGFWFVTAPSPIHKDYPIIMLSRDGKNWSWRGNRTTDFMAVAQGVGATVAVGADGTIMVSHDMGLSWRDVRTTTKRTFRDVCVSKDGTFGIAVGDGGTIYYTKSSIDYWTRSTYELPVDLTSCTIDETDGRFHVYFAGKDGLFYVAKDRSLGQINLVTSTSFENIETLATLPTGEVLAGGGNYQSPDMICEDGFLIIDGQKPWNMWLTTLISLLLLGFWGYTIRLFYLAFIHRNDIEPDESAG